MPAGRTNGSYCNPNWGEAIKLENPNRGNSASSRAEIVGTLDAAVGHRDRDPETKKDQELSLVFFDVC